MILVSIFGVLTLIGIILLIYGIKEEKEGCQSTGLIMFLFTGFMGLGLICGVLPTGKTTEEILVPAEIGRVPTLLVAISPDDSSPIITNEHAIYTAKDNEIRIRKTTHRNSYGSVLDTKKEIVLVQTPILERK